MHLGETSSPGTVTLTNNSNLAVTFSGVSVAPPFTVAANTCGASLAAGNTCSIRVVFTAKKLGRATGALTILDGASDSPQIVKLSGAGR